MKKSRKGVWGFIIHDRQGNRIAAGVGALNHVYDPMKAEVEGMSSGSKGGTTSEHIAHLTRKRTHLI